jgi:hypothetical protein
MASATRLGEARRLVGSGAFVVALLLAMAGCSGGGGASGQAGQCAKDATGSSDITIVDCTSTDAQYKIVGVDEHTSEGGADASCLKYDEASKHLWYGDSGGFGRVLCLQELKK